MFNFRVHVIYKIIKKCIHVVLHYLSSNAWLLSGTVFIHLWKQPTEASQLLLPFFQAVKNVRRCECVMTAAAFTTFYILAAYKPSYGSYIEHTNLVCVCAGGNAQAAVLEQWSCKEF